MISSTAFVDIKCLPQALLLQSAVAVSLMLLEFFSLMISSPAPASLATPATSYTIIVDGRGTDRENDYVKSNVAKWCFFNCIVIGIIVITNQYFYEWSIYDNLHNIWIHPVKTRMVCSLKSNTRNVLLPVIKKIELTSSIIIFHFIQ